MTLASAAGTIGYEVLTSLGRSAITGSTGRPDGAERGG